jgi:hypothetical protein
MTKTYFIYFFEFEDLPKVKVKQFASMSAERLRKLNKYFLFSKMIFCRYPLKLLITLTSEVLTLI